MLSIKNIYSHAALLIGIALFYAPAAYAADMASDDLSSITPRETRGENTSTARTNDRSDRSVLTTRNRGDIENAGTIDHPDHGGPTSHDVLNQAAQTDRNNLRTDTVAGNANAVIQESSDDFSSALSIGYSGDYGNPRNSFNYASDEAVT